MTAMELVERLRECPQLEGVPEAQLVWLATRGRWRRFEPGEILDYTGDQPAEMRFVLKGRIAGFVRRVESSGHRAPPWRSTQGRRRKVIEWNPGDFLGLLPFSRQTASFGETTAIEPSELVTVEREHFPEMICDCYDLTARTVHVMIDRARLFKSNDLHDEKMVSLGKLAAGLAHELNNPASAIARSASDLAEQLAAADETVPAFDGTGLTEAQIGTIKAVRDGCLVARVTSIRSPIEQADREDEITDWLEDHTVDSHLAETLAETLIDVGELDLLAETLGGGELERAVRWIAHSCSTRTLAREIGDAASRIHGLVGAIKDFTHMDRARTRQLVNVAEGLSNTLAMLESKARERQVSAELVLAPELPPVVGFGGELNQVWLNLIDNALDAISDGGRVEVTAALDEDRVVVKVIDSGTGIPEEDLANIFDPFFTTKPVGQGTGLGLDIVRRLVEGHDGEIRVDSRPGRTEFQVELPSADEDGDPQS